LVGGATSASRSIALEAAIVLLVLHSAARYEFWGDNRLMFLAFVACAPALGAVRVAYALRWPARVILLGGMAGAVVGVTMAVATAALSQVLGSDRGRSILEGIAARIPNPITLPIDGGLFTAALAVIAIGIIVLAWRRAHATNLVAHADLVAWATGQGLPVDTSR
jgi:hypothetical protein